MSLSSWREFWIVNKEPKYLKVFFHYFISTTTYRDMYICRHDPMTSKYLDFPRFTAKSISLQAFNSIDTVIYLHTQIRSPWTCFEIPLVSVPPLMQETIFHNQIAQHAILLVIKDTLSKIIFKPIKSITTVGCQII